MRPNSLARSGLALALLTFPALAQKVAPASLELRSGFEANRGQHDPRVRYFTRTGPGATYLTEDGAVLDLWRGGDAGEPAGVALFTTFEGAFESVEAEAERELQDDARIRELDPLPTRLNFFHTAAAEGWISDVPTFAGVRYGEVWPGIDLRWHVGSGRLEYDFELAPGAKPEQIRMRIEGADELAIGPNGELLVETAVGRIVHTIPRIWQESPAGSIERRGRFLLLDEERVGFAVDDRDPSLPLVIDPIVDWGTYFDYHSASPTGASIPSVAIAPDGTIAFVGNEFGTYGMSSTPGAYMQQPADGQNSLGIVGKMSADGSTLLWLSYIGETTQFASAVLYDVEFLSDDRVVVVGFSRADSMQYPLTNNTGISYPFGHHLGGVATIFSADGSNVDWSARVNYGGSARAVAVGSNDELNIVGLAGLYDAVFATPGAYQTTSVALAGFATKVDIFGGGLAYFTLLSQGPYAHNSTELHDVAVDAQGRLFFIGVVLNQSLATPNGFAGYPTDGSVPYYVGRFNATCSQLEYGTYLHVGSSGGWSYSASVSSGYLSTDRIRPGIATDGSGRAWVATTVTTGFSPNTGGAVGGQLDVGIACIDTNEVGLDSLVWARPFGGPSGDLGGGVALLEDRLLIAGNTMSLPISCASVQEADMFVASFEKDTGVHQHTWVIGGEYGESGGLNGFSNLTSPIAVNAQGNLATGGITTSFTGIATTGAYWVQKDNPIFYHVPFLAQIADARRDPCGPSDDEPPVVVIIAPADGSITNAMSTTLVANVEDDSATTVTSSPAGVAPASLAAGGGTVSGLVPLALEGPNVLTVNAVDEFDNAGGSSVSVYRDTLAPLVTVSPAEGTVVGAGPVELLLAIADQTQTQVTLNGPPLGTILVAGGGIYGTATGSLASVRALVEGPNAFTITATDAAGNQTTVVRTIVLDSTAPIVTIVDPANGEWFSATPIPLVASVADDSAVVVSGDLTASLPAGGGTVSGTAGLSEGWNELMVVATDAVGNHSSDSVSVLLDTTPPSVAIVSPAHLALVRGTIDYHATASDPSPGSGVSAVVLRVDALAHESFPVGPYESLLDTTALADGWHTLTAVATDGLGNQAQHQISIRVDNTPPAVSILAPAAGSLLAGDIEFSAYAQDVESGLAQLDMRSGGSVPSLIDGSTSYATPLFDDVRTSVDAAPASDGAWTLSARAVDAAGNEASVAIEVFTDNAAPDKAIVSPADGARVSGAIPIEVAAEDPNLDHLELYVGGVLIAQGTSGSLVVPYDTTLHADGPLEIRLVAVDTLGHTSVCTITVTVANATCFELHPETLNLKSKGGDTSITAKLCGYGLEELLPTEGANLRLCVPGGSSVPTTPGFAGDDHLQGVTEDGFGELLLKFDRQQLIASIRAGIQGGAITGGEVVLTLKAGGDVLATETLRLVGE